MHCISLILALVVVHQAASQSYTQMTTGGPTSSGPVTSTSGPATTTGSAVVTTTGSGGPTTAAPYLSDIQKTLLVIKSIESGNPNDPALNYINKTFFIQHNLGDPPGFKGVQDFVAALNGSAKTNTVRIFEDESIVWAHSIYDVFGPKMGIDCFRFENGLQVEHWDSLQTTAGPNPSGHNMSDGPTQGTDFDKQAANKQLISDYITKVLIGGQSNLNAQFFDGNNLIQHDPVVADGVDKWVAALNDPTTPVKFTFLFKVLGGGNFVLSMAQGTVAGVDNGLYDIWRVANGKIAEHWDVTQPIPPQSQWANPNGKFTCPGACVP